MNKRRSDLACTVLNGMIVVSGGYSVDNCGYKSVEAYDYHEDKWTFLADMQSERSGHFAVSMSNKMFIIGGFGRGKFCEVYDKVSNKFSCIEPPGKYAR